MLLTLAACAAGWLLLQAAQMTTPARPRFTPQLLNMRRVESMLAEQKHFAKANKVRRHRICAGLGAIYNHTTEALVYAYSAVLTAISQ